MYEINLTPIGRIRTPFNDPVGIPIQAVAAQGIVGRIELEPMYREGLRDIEGFSHLILLYHFHLVTEPSLIITPFLDSEPHGIFATRAPKRPNKIGLATVRLVRVEETVLHIEDVDMVDGTPLLDIKPYIPHFDHRPDARIGWYENKVGRVDHVRADGRFL